MQFTHDFTREGVDPKFIQEWLGTNVTEGKDRVENFTKPGVTKFVNLYYKQGEKAFLDRELNKLKRYTNVAV